jgi:hypothetical protein
MFIKKEPGMSPVLAAVLIIPVSAVLTGIICLSEPGVTIWPDFFLNLLPVLLSMLFIFFASGSFAASVIFCLIIFPISTLINYIMVSLFNIQLSYVYFGLLKEIFITFWKIHSIYTSVFLLSVVCFIFVCVFFIRRIKTRPFNKWVRLLAAFIIFTAAFCLNITLYSNENINEKNNCFIYSFVYTLNESDYEPVGREYFLEILAGFETEGEGFNFFKRQD